MARGNPNPKIEQILPYRFPQAGEEPLSKKPFQIRLPKSDYEKLMTIEPSERNQLVLGVDF